MEWIKIESINQFKQSSWKQGFHEYLVASFDSHGNLNDFDIISYESVDPINPDDEKSFYSHRFASWYDKDQQFLNKFTHLILLDQPERLSEKTSLQEDAIV